MGSLQLLVEHERLLAELLTVLFQLMYFLIFNLSVISINFLFLLIHYPELIKFILGLLLFDALVLKLIINLV